MRLTTVVVERGRTWAGALEALRASILRKAVAALCCAARAFLAEIPNPCTYSIRAYLSFVARAWSEI